jgi:hypothetical protein
VNDMLQYLLHTPALLIPILILVAALVFAVLKKLLKMAVILVIAGGLYVLLMRYLGGGM